MKRGFLLIVLCASVVGQPGCLKSISQTEDNGPVVASSDVQSAIANAWGNVEPSTIRKNEFMYLEQDQKISTLDPRVVYKEGTQVTVRSVTPESYDYTLVIQSQSLDTTGSFKPVTSIEQNFSIERDAKAQQSNELAPALPQSIESLQKSMSSGTVGLSENKDGNVQPRALGLQTVLSLFNACVKAQGWDVSCHNLQVSEGLMDPPKGIASKPNCGGLTNCQVHFRKVSFDLVVTLPNDDDDGTHAEKVVYELTISPDVPYLSRLTEFCYQGLVKASGQKVLVKVCNRVQNYEEGAPNPP